MSVEAITWALNLAPVPAGSGGKPSSACAFVLVGLANHAAPDGTAAFPSVETLIRYTRLSERTIRTAMDRLEAEDLIRPGDPAIVAAKIRRADRRPQCWDLAVDRIRTDLSGEELTVLERQFPGLRERVAAARAGAGMPARPCHPGGVRQLHPARETPVDNVADGVRLLHPAESAGCSSFRDGVQLAHERGAAAAPEPSFEPSREPSAAPGPVREDCRPVDSHPGPGGGISEFFTALGPSWPLTAAQQARLAPQVAPALTSGWAPAALAAFAGANTAGVRSPYAVLAARLATGELPAPPRVRPPRPPWCGECDKDTRMTGYYGAAPARCPRCGPQGATRSRSP